MANYYDCSVLSSIVVKNSSKYQIRFQLLVKLLLCYRMTIIFVSLTAAYLAI